MNNGWVQTDAPRRPCCERKLLIADMHPVSRTSFPAHPATSGCKLANTVDGVKGNDDDEGFYLQIRSGPRRGSDGSHAGWMSANSPDNCSEPAPSFSAGDHHIGAHFDQHLRNETDHSTDHQSGRHRYASCPDFDHDEVHHSREEKRIRSVAGLLVA